VPRVQEAHGRHSGTCELSAQAARGGTHASWAWIKCIAGARSVLSRAVRGSG
jgi:hypothetical protein